MTDGGIEMVNLLGGEPTLHANFGEAVQTALAHIDRVHVVTNGHWSERVRETLATLPASS
jgi:molybdenum cofactor biosynthesis enzyme MoaA